MLIEEAIQRVQSAYSKGVQSKDSRLTSRHIYSCLLTGRSTILQRKYNQNQYQSQNNFVWLSCVELKQASLHECPCAPKGTTMLRTVNKLPKLISGIDRPLIGDVTTLDNNISFDRKDIETFRYSGGRKFSSNKPFYFLKNGYLFVGVTTNNLKAIVIPGLFYDPLEAYQFPLACTDDECEDCKCKPAFEYEFPIDGELVGGCIDIAAKEAIYLFSQMKQDRNNDAEDQGNTQGVMVHNPNQDQEQP